MRSDRHQVKSTVRSAEEALTSFSFIIPTFNRAPYLHSAISSVMNELDDSSANVEIIVVDDGSTDTTSTILSSFSDPPVRVIQLPFNSGVCAARMRAISASHGDWLLMFDSDFELIPGTLNKVREATTSAPPNVGNVAYRCQWDTGLTTPYPNPPEGIKDYEAFLRWLDRVEISEWFNCIRREVFETVPYPTGRAHEGGFHLDLVARWDIQFIPDVAVLYKTTADDRLSVQCSSTSLFRDAGDRYLEGQRLLKQHDSALKSLAPSTFAAHHREQGQLALLLGLRLQGVLHTLIALRHNPFRWRTWVTLLVGLISKKALARIKTRGANASRGKILELT